jgi:hypothetical protein
VPTPYASTGAAASAAIACSSRSLVTMIRVFFVAEVVELGPHLAGLRHQVAGVEPHRAQLGPGDLHGRARTASATSYVSTSRVVCGPETRDLGLEGLALAVVEQGEGVRAVPMVGTP